MNKKLTLKSMLLALAVMGVTSAWADTGNATVKMTYVDYDNADTAIGEIAEGETARSGYNKAGTTVTFANTGWGENKIAYLQVDASAIDGTITGATLSLEVTGSSDSKRTTGWGVGYNASEWSADLTYNTADKSITKVGAEVWTSTKSASTFETKEFDITNALKGDEDKVVTILVYELAAAGGYLKNPAVTITYIASGAATADYKVVYVCGGVEVKEAVTRTGAVGTNVKLDDEDKVTFYNEDKTQKFVYASDDAESIEIAEDGSSVITVTFTEAPSYAYSVKGIDESENELFTVAEGTALAGDNAKVAFSQYFLTDGGALLQADKIDDSKKQYNYTFSLEADDTEKTITYKDNGLADVVFYAEGENIDGMKACTGSNVGIRCSASAAGTSSSAVVITTIPAGKYKIGVGLYDNSNSSHHTATFTIGGNKVSFATTNVNQNNYVSEEIEVYSSATQVIYDGVSSTSNGLDYIYIQKTGDVSLPSYDFVTVSEAGYATFCSNYDLDLSGIEAYTAELDGTNVKFTQQKGVIAAGTGLLIKAEQGNLSISVSSESATHVANNALIGVLADTKVAAGSFVLKNAAEGVGFYKANNEFTVGANTAYIAALPAGEEARFIGLGDATAIKAVAAENTDNAVYNLAGQRVAKAQKGLYIVGGKKVIK